MQDKSSNSLFWDIMLSFLNKLKISPSHIQQAIGRDYHEIPKDIYEVYIRIATIGREQGLQFDYFAGIECGEQLLHDLFNDSVTLQVKVIDYYLSLLRMLYATIRLINKCTSKDRPQPKVQELLLKAVDTEFMETC